MVPLGVGRALRTWRSTVAQDPAGNLKPAKDKSIERIDGIVAIIMATGPALVAHEQPEPMYQAFWV